MDYVVTEQRDKAKGGRFYVVEYRPTKADLLRLGGSGVHTNHFYMDPPKNIRGVIENSHWVTRSGKRNPKGTIVAGRLLDDYPAEDPRDPYLREVFTPDWTHWAETKFRAYWERKLQAADEGNPYPQHHRTTINLAVTGNNDDAWEAQNGGLFTASDTRHIVQAWSTTDARINAGARFQNVTVPAGATINSCVLQIKAIATSEDDMRGDAFFEDVDDAADFATTADVTSRAVTASSVSWVALATGAVYVSSPSLVVPCQAVINRGGWASGNDVVVIVKGKNATNNTGNFYGESFDNAGTSPSLLDIDYTAAGATAVRDIIGMGMVIPFAR